MTTTALEDPFEILVRHISFLTSEQINGLTQTVRQFFTDSDGGRQIAACHSYLPCFREPEAAQQTVVSLLPTPVLAAFDALSAGAAPPDSDALQLAKSWAESLYREIKTQKSTWILPHLTVQDGGDVVFEWWQGQKSLSVYVSSEEVWFLQSAGSDSPQAEGDANSLEARQSIWRWLTD